MGFIHTYSLRNTIKYYYPALTGIKDDDTNAVYHFMLLLKSIQSYNNTTGKINPFNFFNKSDKKRIATLAGIPNTRFNSLLQKCIFRGWVTPHELTYSFISIDRINKSLYFKPTTHAEKREYYPYTRLINVKDIDLQAHKIYELIKQSSKRFKQVATTPHNKSRITSSANKKFIADSHRSKNTGKVKSKEMFAISMDTLEASSGFSKNKIQLLIKKMQLQGLEVIKDKSAFNRYRKRHCNKYNVNQQLVFVDGTYEKLKLQFNPVIVKPVIKFSEVENKFNASVNITSNRIDLINAGILSRNYLKFTKKGLLVKIPKKAWGNVIIGILSDEGLRNEFLKHFSTTNIKVIQVEKNAMFPQILIGTDRFGKVS